MVDGLKAVGIEAKLQGNAAQNAANQNNIHANSLDGVAGAANNATNALSDYLKKLQQSTFKTELTNKLIGNYGFDPERAKAFAEHMFRMAIRYLRKMQKLLIRILPPTENSSK